MGRRRHGRSSPLLTALFLHANWLHLLGNVLFLYVFGGPVEQRMGPVRFALCYVSVGYIAMLCYAVAHHHSTQTLVGASGAVSGVLGAFLYLYPRARVTSVFPFLLFLPLRFPAWLVLVFWLALQWIAARQDDGRARRRLPGPRGRIHPGLPLRLAPIPYGYSGHARSGDPGRVHTVITSIVLIKTSTDRIPEIAEQIAALDSVSEVYSVTGAHDLIAMVRVAHHDDLADVIPGRISKVPGVLSTETHIAFRTYSQHDLESAFAIGLDA